MKPNDFYLVNAFTGNKASGNQCCVLMLDDLSDADQLLSIAADFNLPATAFLKQVGESEFDVRWFAPIAEIELCGHGTIAATHVIAQTSNSKSPVQFNFKKGQLQGLIFEDKVAFRGELFQTSKADIPEKLQAAFHGKIKEYYPSAGKHLILMDFEEEVVNADPDWELLKQIDVFAYAITAKGTNYDFVSRTLLPHIPYKEDHATGSSHLVLAPFWAKKLNKESLTAFQKSSRGGVIECEVEANSVVLKSNCKIFGKGKLL